MRCPYCKEDRLIERLGAQWFCQVCAKTWPLENTPETLSSFFFSH